MKVYKYINISIKQILMERRTVIISFLILLVGSLYYGMNQYRYVESLTLNILGEKVPINIFDVLTSIEGLGGAIGPLSIITIVLPTYIILLLKTNGNSTLFSKYRLGSTDNIWINKIYTSSILSFFYSIILIFIPYILGSLYLGSFKCNWSSTNSVLQKLLIKQDMYIGQSYSDINEFKIIFIVFLLLFLGLNLIGILVNFTNNITRNKALTFIVIFSICFIEVLLVSGTPILVGKLFIKLAYLKDKLKLIINIFSLILLIMISYSGGKLLERNNEVV